MASTLSDIANIYAADNASKEDIERGIQYHRRAVELIDPIANRHELSTHYYNLGVAYMRTKDYGQAKPYLDKSLAIARDLKDEHAVAYVNFRLGVIAVDEGRIDDAMAYFDKALPVFKETEKASMQFMTHLGLARALAAKGKRKESIAALGAAQPIAKRLGSPKREAQYFEASSEVYSRLGDFEQAFWEMGELRSAERQVAATANLKQQAELAAKFSAQQRETENTLLKMEQAEQQTRRVLLLLALMLSSLFALALVLYAIRQARQNRRFANLAMRDDLTGLPNRRSILEFATIQFKGRRAGDKGFVVAIVDIDHFKSINDTFGHTVGDAVLVAYSHACQRQLRSDDRMGRFGGEEFMIVMPGSEVSRIPAVFQRLREAVMRMEAPGYPHGRGLTFSMGATAAKESDIFVDDIIRRADEALYRAKEGGRDRFEIA